MTGQSDQSGGDGSHAAPLSPGEYETLREHLETCLVDRWALVRHLQGICRGGQGGISQGDLQNDVPPDSQFDLLVHGEARLAALDGGQLARLSRNPAALIALYDRILEELPAAWHALQCEAGRRCLEQKGLSVPSVDELLGRARENPDLLAPEDCEEVEAESALGELAASLAVDDGEPEPGADQQAAASTDIAPGEATDTAGVGPEEGADLTGVAVPLDKRDPSCGRQRLFRRDFCYTLDQTEWERGKEEACDTIANRRRTVIVRLEGYGSRGNRQGSWVLSVQNAIRAVPVAARLELPDGTTRAGPLRAHDRAPGSWELSWGNPSQGKLLSHDGIVGAGLDVTLEAQGGAWRFAVSAPIGPTGLTREYVDQWRQHPEKEGDAAPQEYARCVLVVECIIRKRCRQCEAEEFVNAASTKLWERRHVFAGDGEFESFAHFSNTLIRTAVQLHAQFHRGSGPAEVALDNPDDVPDARWPGLTTIDLPAALEDCMEQCLDETERQLLKRRFFDGETIAHIARDLGMPYPQARNRLLEALARLTGCLIKKGVDPAEWRLF